MVLGNRQLPSPFEGLACPSPITEGQVTPANQDVSHHPVRLSVQRDPEVLRRQAVVAGVKQRFGQAKPGQLAGGVLLDEFLVFVDQVAHDQRVGALEPDCNPRGWPRLPSQHH